MNIEMPGDELCGAVECMSFVAEFLSAQAPSISGALETFMGCYDDERCSNVKVLRDELLSYADQLAWAMGFPDADMDPAKTRPRRRLR